MALCQNATTIVYGFFTEFDPLKTFAMFQAWWQIVYEIVGLARSDLW